MLLDNIKQAENEKQTVFERLYCVVFNCSYRNIRHDKIIYKNHDMGSSHRTKY